MSKAARAAIESGNRAFIEAFFRGDAQAVASIYTEDARVIAPDSKIATGRAAIAVFWQAVMDTGVKTLTLDTGEVESTGGLAYEDGLVRIVAANDQISVGRYVVVWKRKNGEWKIHRDIWNAE